MPEVQKRVVEQGALKPGDAVLWRWVTHRGYGGSALIPARVEAVGPRKVQIAVKLEGGGEKLTWVMLKSLRWPKQ